jgi:estrone sulfotransferase
MNSEHGRVFIVSYPRSGNTWVRLLLEYSLGFETQSVYAIEQNERRRESYHPLSRVTNNDQHIVRSPEIDIVKSHAFAVEGESPVIYVLRDGRDATVSYWHFARSFWKRPVGTFSEFLRELHRTGDWWPHHVYQWLDYDKLHPKLVVRFEDLISDQKKETERMLDFLHLDPVRKFGDFEESAKFEKLHEVIPSFFREGKTGTWREAFQPKDEEFFLRYGLGMLQRYGYEATSGSTVKPSSGFDQTDAEVLDGWVRRYQRNQTEIIEKDGEINRLASELERLNRSLVEKEDQIKLLHSVAEERLQELEKKEQEIKLLASLQKRGE